MKYDENRYTAKLSEKKKISKQWVRKDYALKFDLTSMIFYSQKYKDAAVNICSEKKAVKDYNKVSLSSDVYVYFKNVWYQKGSKCYLRM